LVWEKAQRIAKNPSYQITKISKKNLTKFAEDFRTIYNSAWGRYTGVKRITPLHALTLLKTVKPVLDERLIYFAYHNNEPIGFLIMLPDLNQVVKYMNGDFSLLGKIKFIYLLKFKKVCHKALGIIFGVIPSHQGKGLEGAMINELAKQAFRKDFPYTEIELNWIGDFNPAMNKVAEQIGGKIRKIHITYRFMFDRSKNVLPPRKVS
jgi:GNAT superfamily N-acetyltransferase